MRVFIGIKASKTLQKKVARWHREHRDLPVRWIKARNLHITLVPPAREEEIRKKFEEIKKKKIKRFVIIFKRVVSKSKYHVICAETKGYHVTVARFKGKIELPLEKIRWTEKVDSITLFQSKLGPKEAMYYEIEKILVR